MLAALPAGRYLLAGSRLPARRAARVLLGNEWMPQPRELLDAPPHHAMLVGPHADRPPATAHPLVGLVAPNYTGGSSPHGVLFFDVAGARRPKHPRRERP